MTHEQIGDCQFRSRCPTFNDPLIEAVHKGPAGRGCSQRNDLFRTKHCRNFRCSYMCLVLTDALRQPSPRFAKA